MKKITLLLFLLLVFGTCLSACKKEAKEAQAQYHFIDAKEAKKLMDEKEDYLIIDVRSKEEYEDSHIKDAINIPNEVISDKAIDILKDKQQLLLIYCRSGRRSKEAAMKLADLGYVNVYDFGGIQDWLYETEK